MVLQVFCKGYSILFLLNFKALLLSVIMSLKISDILQSCNIFDVSLSCNEKYMKRKDTYKTFDWSIHPTIFSLQLSLVSVTLQMATLGINIHMYNELSCNTITLKRVLKNLHYCISDGLDSGFYFRL